MVYKILVEDGKAVGIETEKGETFYAEEIVSAVGREGADWFKDKCGEIGIETMPGTVDIGVRVEVRDEVMQFLNENLYEAKLVLINFIPFLRAQMTDRAFNQFQIGVNSLSADFPDFFFFIHSVNTGLSVPTLPAKWLRNIMKAGWQW